MNQNTEFDDEYIRNDPLTMLRAARGVAETGIDLDSGLKNAILKNAGLIYSAGKESWTSEIDKLLAGRDPAKGLQALADTELLRYMLPELWLQVGFDQDSPYHDLTLWEHTKRVVELSPADALMRWAALLHDVGKPFAKKKNSKGRSSYFNHDIIGAEIARDIAFRLGWTTERAEETLSLIERHMKDDSPLRVADNGAKG